MHPPKGNPSLGEATASGSALSAALTRSGSVDHSSEPHITAPGPQVPPSHREDAGDRSVQSALLPWPPSSDKQCCKLSTSPAGGVVGKSLQRRFWGSSHSFPSSRDLSPLVHLLPQVFPASNNIGGNKISRGARKRLWHPGQFRSCCFPAVCPWPGYPCSSSLSFPIHSRSASKPSTSVAVRTRAFRERLGWLVEHTRVCSHTSLSLQRAGVSALFRYSLPWPWRCGNQGKSGTSLPPPSPRMVSTELQIQRKGLGTRAQSCPCPPL